MISYSHIFQMVGMILGGTAMVTLCWITMMSYMMEE